MIGHSVYHQEGRLCEGRGILSGIRDNRKLIQCRPGDDRHASRQCPPRNI